MISFINLVLACLITKNTRENAKLKWFEREIFCLLGMLFVIGTLTNLKEVIFRTEWG